MLHAWLDTLGPGYEVLDMPSGEEALLESTRRGVDLLIVDVRLPGMSGLELMDRISRRGLTAKVILITGVTDTKILRQVETANAFAYFIKPIEMNNFLDTVERALGVEKTVLVPPSGAIPSETTQSLPERLASLRKEIKADAVWLLNDQGQILARAGDLPENEENTALIPSLMGAFSSSVKISHLLGLKEPQNLLQFSGANYHLVMTPVGRSHAVLVVTRASRSAEVSGAAGRNLLSWAESLRQSGILEIHPEISKPEIFQASLEAGGSGEFSSKETVISPLPAQPSAGEVAPEELADLENMLSRKSQDRIEAKAINSFWDEALEKENPADTSNTSALSYEEALKLGLTPNKPEDKESK